MLLKGRAGATRHVWTGGLHPPYVLLASQPGCNQGMPTGVRPRIASGLRWLTAVSYTHLDVYKRQANGQTYVLPAGAFFEIRNGKVARISNYYNLNDWVAQVG